MGKRQMVTFRFSPGDCVVTDTGINIGGTVQKYKAICKVIEARYILDKVGSYKRYIVEETKDSKFPKRRFYINEGELDIPESDK